MKILVVCQHYWPEPYPLKDVCEELVGRGHEVHLITGIPNYPMGKIYPGYKKRKNRRQIHNGVRITRTFTIGRRKGIFFRFLNYYSYMISSMLEVLKLGDEYDVVFTNQTSPVMMSSAAMTYAKKWKKRVVLYCLDLWPASLSVGGIKENSLIYRYYHRVSRKIYRKADKLLISSKMFRKYLKDNFDIADERIAYHPQYANDCFTLETNHQKRTDPTINLVFAGNIGAAQNLTTIIRAAELLKDEANLRWHILGEGSELEKLKILADQLELNNVIFYGRKPLEEMPKYYQMADAMLVTFIGDPVISMTLPGKIQSYLAAGKPIIAAADGEIRNVIQDSQCGYCAKAGDAVEFSEMVRKFILCENKQALGQNARDYYERCFSKEVFIRELERELANQ